MNETRASGAALFDLLVELDTRCRTRGAGLPDAAARADFWAGVLFRLGDHALLAPLAEVVEVLETPPDITAVPGTKSWFLGVANNRGTLLPIIDLDALNRGEPAAVEHTDRILVVRQSDLPCGLLVNAVIGIRHFEHTGRVAPAAAGIGVLESFVEGAFMNGERPLAVLGLERMLADPLLNAALA